MNVEDFRKQLERDLEVAHAQPVVHGGPSSDALKAISSPTPPTEEELELAALRTLSNDAAPAEARVAAIITLKGAAHHSSRFHEWRPQFLLALRKAVASTDDDLRLAVLSELAVYKDRYAQDLLLEGLHEPAKALLPPVKALELLGYDVHVDARAEAEAIADAPPDPETREEALRLLARYTESTPRFTKLLHDSSEPLAVRQIAATALRSLDRHALQDFRNALHHGRGAETTPEAVAGIKKLPTVVALLDSADATKTSDEAILFQHMAALLAVDE